MNYKDDWGFNALICASLKGHKEIVSMLISNGSNINQEDEDKQSPLHWAVKKGHKEVVEILEFHGAQW